MSLTSLTAPQRRVIGVLIEKSLTTPQSYPLSLNAVTTGCNQKSNRDPVIEYVEEEVDTFLEELKKLHLITVVYPASGRVEKYRQEFSSMLDLDGKEMAVMGELLLRGAQSVGELRTRASRMKAIESLPELESVLDRLEAREHPLVVRLTPHGVKRGVRYTHNLYPPAELERVKAAEPEVSDVAVGPSPSRPAAPAAVVASAPNATISALEREIRELRERLEIVEGRLGIVAD
ncbi:MAG: YceH family protein [Planctomycetes bacterium]|nr:YceH family protein [Planctomycetota bacterium]